MKKAKLTKEELQEMIHSYQSDLRMLEFEMERVISALSTLQKMTPIKEKKSKKSTTGKKRGRPRKNATAKTAAAPKKRGRKPGKVSAQKKAGKTTVVKKAKGKRGRPKKEAPAVKTAKKGPAKKIAAKPSKAVAVKKNKKVSKKPLKKTVQPKAEKKVHDNSKTAVWEKFILNALHETKKAMIKSDLLLLAKTSPTGITAGLTDKTINQQISNSIQKLVKSSGPVVKTYHLGRGDAFALKEWVDKENNVLPEFER